MKTNEGLALTVLAMGTSAGVLLLSGYLYYLKPERPWPMLVSIAIVGVAWIVRGMCRGDSEAMRKSRLAVTQSIVLACLLLGAPMISGMGWTSDETGKRIVGVLGALVVVVFANVIPKHATCPQALHAASRRLGAGAWRIGIRARVDLLPLSHAGGDGGAACGVGVRHSSLGLVRRQALFLHRARHERSAVDHDWSRSLRVRDDLRDTQVQASITRRFQ
jgi:hypothetical protein